MCGLSVGLLDCLCAYKGDTILKCAYKGGIVRIEVHITKPSCNIKNTTKLVVYRRITNYSFNIIHFYFCERNL